MTLDRIRAAHADVIHLVHIKERTLKGAPGCDTCEVLAVLERVEALALTWQESTLAADVEHGLDLESAIAPEAADAGGTK
jgi:hypothetical protein